MDEIKRLIKQAHNLFDQHSIFEIIDIEDRAEAIRVMIEIHGPGVNLAMVKKYLAILDRLRG